MKREHKLEALCVDGSVISFDQIQAMRGRIVRHGSWHYLQVDGEPERAVVIRPTLREHLRTMGDYARSKRKEKPNYSIPVKLRGNRGSVYFVDEAHHIDPFTTPNCRCEPVEMKQGTIPPEVAERQLAVYELGAKIVRQLHPDLYELPQLDNMRRSDGEPESYVMV